MILAIDPGNIESAYVLLDDNLKPIQFDKVDNEKLLEDLNMDRFFWDEKLEHRDIENFAIEMVAHYGTGMPAGKEVFDTCVWIGRFIENANFENREFIYRKDEKINLCGSMKAKDGNIIQALVDRFAPGEANRGKGTKKEHGWFYGFHDDIWQAYAVGVTFHDLYLKEEKA